MTEWWTYRLDDFLMFAPGTYQRMFALYNAQVWPAPLLALPLGLAVLWGLARRPAAWRLACVAVALGWAFTAWAFHWQRYAGIHTAAPWFAAVFAVQALVLMWIARPASPWRPRAGPPWVRGIALALLAFAVLLQPWTGLALGRPWQQAALFGLTPDATAVGTLGLLLALVRERSAGPPRAGARQRVWVARSAAAGALPWLLPLLWCLASAATLWTLGAPEASLLLTLAGIATVSGLAACAVQARARAAGPAAQAGASPRGPQAVAAAPATQPGAAAPATRTGSA